MTFASPLMPTPTCQRTSPQVSRTPSRPGGVPLFVASEVAAKTAWAIPSDWTYAVVREGTRADIDRSAYSSSGKTGDRGAMRVGFGFPDRRPSSRSHACRAPGASPSPRLLRYCPTRGTMDPDGIFRLIGMGSQTSETRPITWA